jgi:predicted phosphodiesterase
MKFDVLSDIHLESRSKGYQLKEEGDLLLLAGDICTVTPSITLSTFLAQCKSKYKEVVYVAGNHEFYGSELGTALKQLRNICKVQGVHFLDNEVVEIEGRKIVGATLWSDLSNPIAAMYAGNLMNDYLAIKYGVYSLSTSHTDNMYQISRQFIKDNHEEGCIILTHHAPSFLSIADKWRGHKVNAAYASNMSELSDMPPCTWVHGHTHNKVDYYIGNVNVISRPVGYEWESH